MKCYDGRECYSQDAAGNCKLLTDTHFLSGCPFWHPRQDIDENAEFTLKDHKGVWKKIKGYDYMVSTEGEVMSKHHRIVKPIFEQEKAAYRITLYKKGEKKKFYLAQLVAAAFLPGSGRIVHKNGDKRDCRVENLVRRD